MKYLLKSFCILVHIVFTCSLLAGCSYDAEVKSDIDYITIGETKIPNDAVEINLNNKNLSDISPLYKLKNLEHLDIRNNSINPDDITAFMLAMPQCEVLWSVPFNNVLYDNTTAILDFSEAKTISVAKLGETLNYFDNLKQVQLTNSHVTAAEYKELKAVFSDVYICLKVDIGGQHYDADAVELDLSKNDNVDAETLISALEYFDKIKSVKFGKIVYGQSFMEQVCEAYPEMEFDWCIYLSGKEFAVDSKEIDISGRKIESYEVFRDKLKFYGCLEHIDMCDCGLRNNQMEQLTKLYPNIKFVWKVKIGYWELRTDVKAFSTGHSGTFEGGRYVGGGYYLRDYHVEALKYCTDLIALDIGHQKYITDFSFLEYMPKLQILIVALTRLKDMSLLTHMQDLTYLEIFSNYMTDLSPLTKLPNLKYLNCSGNAITDVDALVEMKQLEQLWMTNCPYLPDSERDRVEKELPDCEIKFHAKSPTHGGWRGRDNEAYIWMREVFQLRPMFSS